MKNIAVIVNDLSLVFAGALCSGGGGVVVKNLLLNLADDENVNLTVFTMKNGVVDIKNAELIEIPYFFHSDEFFAEIDRVLNERNFDIVISTLWNKCYKNICLQGFSYEYRLKNAPCFIKIFKKKFSVRKINAQKEYFKDLDRNAKIITVSELCKNDYVENLGLNPDNFIVSYPGTTQIYETFPSKTQKSKITFGAVLGKSLNKGGLFLFFALLIAKIIGVKFNIKAVVSNNRYKKLLKIISIIFGYGKYVEFLPASEDLSSFYSNIDCLILPSFAETFGLVVLETMANGSPCIVTSTAGAKEILSQDSGWIFDRKSLLSLILTIRQVSNLYVKDFNKYNQIAKNAFELSKQYSWSNFVSNIINKF